MSEHDFINKIIGGCEILRKIGEGGMGVIYEAEQSSLGRRVALKFLAPHLAHNKDFVSRFMREAKSAANFSHPNVMQVINVEKDDDMIYMITELVRGKNLREIMAESGVFPEFDALSVINDVASALVEAERNNIVHRDLKPDNIMITDMDIVKVMDFGLAKDTSSATQAITQIGAILGTPQYMSPEQIRGENVDIRSDIYSLGLILFYLVTGKKAFDGDTSVQIFHDQIYTPLPDPRSVNPDISEPVRSMIIKMTKKKAEERFQSPLEIVQAIKLLKKDEKEFSKVFKKQKIETIYHPSQKKNKNTILSAAAGLLVVIILLGAFYFFNRKNDVRQEANKIASQNKEKIVLRWDPSGEITFLNKYGQECFGYDAEEILGKNVMGYIVPKTETSGHDLEAMMADIQKNPEKYRNNINENICSSGELIWIQWANTPVYGKKGTLKEIHSVGEIVQDPKTIIQLRENKRQAVK